MDQPIPEPMARAEIAEEETGPTYISSPDCALPEPVPTDDLIGLPPMHLVMNVFYRPVFFLRGDADGNGTFNGLADGSY